MIVSVLPPVPPALLTARDYKQHTAMLERKARGPGRLSMSVSGSQSFRQRSESWNVDLNMTLQQWNDLQDIAVDTPLVESCEEDGAADVQPPQPSATARALAAAAVAGGASSTASAAAVPSGTGMAVSAASHQHGAQSSGVSSAAAASAVSAPASTAAVDSGSTSIVAGPPAPIRRHSHIWHGDTTGSDSDMSASHGRHKHHRRRHRHRASEPHLDVKVSRDRCRVDWSHTQLLCVRACAWLCACGCVFVPMPVGAWPCCGSGDVARVVGVG